MQCHWHSSFWGVFAIILGLNLDHGVGLQISTSFLSQKSKIGYPVARHCAAFALTSSKSDQDIDQLFSGGDEWKGRPEILIRRKEFPQKGQTPEDVVRLCLNRLQINDDPQLDHGAAVVVKFASPNSAISQMNPRQYGDFLRKSEDFSILVDSTGFKMISPFKVSEDGARAVQGVLVRGPAPALATRAYDVVLSRGPPPPPPPPGGEGGGGKEEGLWLVDALLVRSEGEEEEPDLAA